MPQVMHMPAPGVPVHAAPPDHDHPNAGSHIRWHWSFGTRLAALVLAILVIASVLIYRIAYSPALAAGERRVAAMRQQLEARRRARAASPAGAADRILASETGRRAQQDLLRSSEDGPLREGR